MILEYRPPPHPLIIAWSTCSFPFFQFLGEFQFFSQRAFLFHGFSLHLTQQVFRVLLKFPDLPGV